MNYESGYPSKKLLMRGVFSLLFSCLILFASLSSFVLAADDATPEEDYQYKLLETLPFAGEEGTTVGLPQYIQGIFSLGIAIVGIAALLMISIGGFWYVTAAGNASQASKGKEIISDALLGLFIALFAWLILYVVNPNLTQYQFGGFAIETGPPSNCSVGQDQENCGLGTKRGSSGNVVRPCDGGNCVSTENTPYDVKSVGVACAPEAGASQCKISVALDTGMRGMATSSIGQAVKPLVTEVWPPTADHASACHFNGTCIDVSIPNEADRTAENIRDLSVEASENNMNWIYEVKTTERRDELLASGLFAPGDIIVVPSINGEHFSAYEGQPEYCGTTVTGNGSRCVQSYQQCQDQNLENCARAKKTS